MVKQVEIKQDSKVDLIVIILNDSHFLELVQEVLESLKYLL